MAKKVDELSKGEAISVGSADAPRELVVKDMTVQGDRATVEFESGERWDVPVGTMTGVDAPAPEKPGKK